jgi:hypothetical protein
MAHLLFCFASRDGSSSQVGPNVMENKMILKMDDCQTGLVIIMSSSGIML